MREPARAREQDGMSAATAKTIESAIIVLCLAALAMIFQPFSLTLYGIGAGLKVVLIILIILVVALALAIATTYLYAWYLEALR
jgi:hypothetical protein